MKIYNASLKGNRPTNEDKHNIIVNNKIKLFGIYDGHGGTHVSAFLEKYIPEFYCSSKLTPPFEKELHEDIFDFIQKKVLSTKKGFSSGSTCCIAIIYNDTKSNEQILNVINVGDSRACIVKKDNTVKQITVDHKPDEEKEKTRIEKTGGEVYVDTEGITRVGDLSLSRAIGDGDQLPHVTHKPDIFYKKLNKTKYIVLACDGLWDVILNDELGVLIDQFKQNMLNNKTTLNPAKSLAELAITRGSNDNVSVIIVDLEI